jgi:hypothetical protein
MRKHANIPIEGENSSYNVDDRYFKHNPKRHRVSKDIIVPADKGLHQRILNLFKVRSFQNELSKLIRN